MHQRCVTAALCLLAVLQPPLAAQELASPAAVRDAVRRAIPLLQSSADTWFERRSCSSCHHQGVGSLAVAMAEEAGFPVDSTRLLQQARRTLDSGADWLERFVTLEASINEPIGQSYRALGVAAIGYPPSPITEGIVHVVSAQQHVSGRWGVSSRRPPHEDSDFTATALSIRTLQLYASATQRADAERQIARARMWLQQATPEETEDQVMQLLGLLWAGQRVRLEPYVTALRDGQRADGGWGQIPTRPSDAYATGQALVALQHAGGMSPSDPVLQRGYRFLVRTQQSDGSWHVGTRRTSSDGQPYFESGFPHGRDQFISYAGSAWALMALSFAQSSAPSDVLLGGSRARIVVRADTLPDSRLTPLMRTALSGTADDVSALIREGHDVNARTESGLTALMCAVRDSVKIRLLLDAGADPDVRTSSGHSALLLAAATDGAESSVRLLLARGAAVDQPAVRSNHAGLAPLGRAIARGDTIVAALLLQHGARVDGPERVETTPLLNAVFFGDAPSAEWLLRHGASADGVPSSGETPLMIAAADGRTAVVRTLLAGGATVDRTDREGFSALHYAAEAPDRAVYTLAELLLDAGADPDRPTLAGETPSQLAARWGKHGLAARLGRRQ